MSAVSAMKMNKCLLHLASVLLVIGVSAAYAADKEPFTVVSAVNLLAKNKTANKVTVSFSARVFNDSPADLLDATITLQHAAFSQPLATFSGISIPRGGSVVLTQEFSAPKALYDTWNRGSVMSLRITSKGIDGNQIRHFVTLATPR
jgi:hypothetical protein